MQKTDTIRRIENVVDAVLTAIPVVDAGEDLREEFTEEYEAFLRIGDALHDLIKEVSARDTTDTDLWNGLFAKTAALSIFSSGPVEPSLGGDGTGRKTQAFMDLEKVVYSMRDMSTEDVEGFCASMDIGNALVKLAERVSERDETDTDHWNELIRTIHTIAAGTDDIPDKDEIGRDRHIENTGRGCRKLRGLK